MQGFPEPWGAILKGVGVGAVLGGSIATANHFIAKSKAPAIDLKVPACALLQNAELSAVINGFTPLRDLSERTRNLYDTMVISCNYVVNAEMEKVKGSEQFKASRAALQTIASAKALCREAAKMTQKGAKSETDPFEAMRDIETLEGLVNNHLHNIMIT